jgi:fructose-specific phosphotransferase system IIC component
MLLSIGGAGFIGGLLNGLLAQDGFVLPKTDRLPNGQRIWRPGILGNAVVGVVTAVVLAGLYSPLGAVPLGGSLPNPVYTLTIGGVAGALLSGIGGARLLANEVDRRFSNATKEQLANAFDEWIKTQK